MIRKETISLSSQTWKNNERQVAKTLNDWGIAATRKMGRMTNYSISDFDVEVEEAPWLKPDAKYSIKGFRTNRILDETTHKYCKEKGDFAVLFCKGFKELGQKAVMDSELFAGLLSYWLGKKTKEEVIAQWKS
jgi:hypothetical protein